jgi:hypothetical protein
MKAFTQELGHDPSGLRYVSLSLAANYCRRSCSSANDSEQEQPIIFSPNSETPSNPTNTPAQ